MRIRVALLTVSLIITPGCGDEEETDTSHAVRSIMIELPQPSAAGGASFTEVLAARRSIREFTDDTLELAKLSQLLWATQGITSEDGKRTAPSAGATYPLELYLITESGLYHYQPDQHSLLQLAQGDLRAELSAAALDQRPVAEAAATFAITAVYARTAERYGDRAERYVKLEAGHAAQNLLLQAVALDLAAVPIGAFTDTQVSEVLRLPADHEPLYLIAVGRPADS